MLPKHKEKEGVGRPGCEQVARVSILARNSLDEIDGFVPSFVLVSRSDPSLCQLVESEWTCASACTTGRGWEGKGRRSVA